MSIASLIDTDAPRETSEKIWNYLIQTGRQLLQSLMEDLPVAQEWLSFAADFPEIPDEALAALSLRRADRRESVVFYLRAEMLSVARTVLDKHTTAVSLLSNFVARAVATSRVYSDDSHYLYGLLTDKDLLSDLKEEARDLRDDLTKLWNDCAATMLGHCYDGVMSSTSIEVAEKAGFLAKLSGRGFEDTLDGFLDSLELIQELELQPQETTIDVASLRISRKRPRFAMVTGPGEPGSPVSGASGASPVPGSCLSPPRVSRLRRGSPSHEPSSPVLGGFHD